LKTAGVERGRLLDYQIYHEDVTDSKVSYASMVFC
jgi:predicted class III extradiol MEMO1 family dioxygenase